MLTKPDSLLSTDMGKRFLIFLVLVVSGCVTVDYTSRPVAQSTVSQPGPFSGRTVRFNEIKNVYEGMSKAEVHQSFGSQVRVGHDAINVRDGTYKELFVPNPYRTESVTSEDRSYSVEFYLTEIKKADGIVADDELTPLVFEEDRLAGKGWDYLFELRNR